MIDDFLIITYWMCLVTLWAEVDYGRSSLLQICDCSGTAISVTVCEFQLLWHTVREIRMEIIPAGSGVQLSDPFISDLPQSTITVFPLPYITYNCVAFPPSHMAET
jgi:hypothetical protein